MLKVDPRLVDDTRPVVGLDIDGVLNLWCGGSTEPGLRYLRRNVLGYKITWRTDLLALLQPLVDADARGDIQLAWATMWEELAPTRFAPAVLNGLGMDWPVIYFTTANEGETLAERKAEQDLHEQTQGFNEVYLKTPPMAEIARVLNRPMLWIDDGTGPVDQAYLEERAEYDGVPAVECVMVDERVGLTARTVEYALMWVEDQAVIA